MTSKRSLLGNVGGPGDVSPHPEAVEVRQPWRARMRSRFPQRHRSSSRASGEEFGQEYRASEDLGVSKGGRLAPHFGPGIRKGGETPLRLSLPTFCRSRK